MRPLTTEAAHITPPLPWALWVAKVDLDVRGQGEAAVRRHFLAPIPGQQFVQLMRQLVCIPDQRIGDGLLICTLTTAPYYFTRLMLFV